MHAELLEDIRDGIAVSTLNRPQARNAMTFPMYEGLAAMAARVAADDAIKVWIITGAGGRAFAAGTDINQFRDFSTPQDALDYEARIDRVLIAIELCPKPVVAAIAGACTGGGAAIAGVCDLRIGAANAKIGMPIARTLGNCLSMANYARFAALIGPARLTDLVFTARLMEAPEALAAGFLTEVLDTPEALAERARALAVTIAGHAPLTLRATKEALRRLRQAAHAVPGDDLVTLCFGSDDFAEGVRAFLAKRPPVWRGL